MGIVEHKFSDSCPECGPNGTKPIQSLRDWVLVEPCQTCAEKQREAMRQVGYFAAKLIDEEMLAALRRRREHEEMAIESEVLDGSLDNWINYFLASSATLCAAKQEARNRGFNEVDSLRFMLVAMAKSEQRLSNELMKRAFEQLPADNFQKRGAQTC